MYILKGLGYGKDRKAARKTRQKIFEESDLNSEERGGKLLDLFEENTYKRRRKGEHSG